jgi:hypothetical protein
LLTWCYCYGLRFGLSFFGGEEEAFMAF